MQEHLKRHGLQLALDDGVAGFKQLDGGAIEVQTDVRQDATRQTS